MTAELPAELSAYLSARARAASRAADISKTAAAIVERVKREGDRAVLELTRQFDAPKLQAIEVGESEWKAALKAISPKEKKLLKTVHARLTAFYESMRPDNRAVVDSAGFFAQRWTPVDSAGLYVPGGNAPLVSTVFMLGVPARVAGCAVRVMASPPGPDGKLPAVMLAAAREAGIARVFKMGGAQAIAALAYGTKSVPAVDKIFGPGNLYVTMAKKYVFGQVGVDSLAGPSELMIIADAQADPKWIFEDLLAQAEHGPDSATLLVSTSEPLLKAVRKLIPESIKKQVFLARAANLDDAASCANRIAPEHLQLAVEAPQKLLPLIRHAGAIFLGPLSATAFGDYIAGPNHTLPTAGTARFSSALTVYDFMKASSVIAMTPAGVKQLAPLAEQLAAIEGLEHHQRSLAARRKG